MKTTSMSKPVRSLGYIKCYSSSSPRPIKSPSNLIRYNCQKSENRPHFYRWPISLLFISFSKNLLTTEGRLTKRQFSAVYLSSKFLNTGTTDETFQQSGKQDLLNRSANMYGSPGSQFFTATTGIQSGPDAFYESRFIMNFLTILGIKKILYSFRLILERRAGKEIPSLQD